MFICAFCFKSLFVISYLLYLLIKGGLLGLLQDLDGVPSKPEPTKNWYVVSFGCLSMASYPLNLFRETQETLDDTTEFRKRSPQQGNKKRKCQTKKCAANNDHDPCFHDPYSPHI